MRPRGDIRMALGAAAAEFGRAGATWRDMAVRTCVGFDVARQTARDMARAGELLVVGEHRASGVNRPMVRYALAPGFEAADAGAVAGAASAAELAAVVRCWADFK